MRILVVLLLSSLVLGSVAWGKPKNKADLKLTASIQNADPDEQTTLIVDIVNQSGHTLRIPDPPLLCSPAPGALSIEVKFVPQDSQRKNPAAECESQVDGSGLPDILERSKNWLVLKQGQSYEARRPLSMGLNAGARGTYDLWVIYDGPCANDAEVQELKGSDVAVPEGRFKSEKITYRVGEPK